MVVTETDFNNLYRRIGLSWWFSGREATCQFRRLRFDSSVEKIPWRKKWQPTRVFLPRKSHGQRNFGNCSSLYACMLSHFSHVQLSATPWTVAHKAPLSKGFSRQEYWSGLLCLPPGDLPDPGIEPWSPASPTLANAFFTTSAPWTTLSVTSVTQSCPLLFDLMDCSSAGFPVHHQLPATL